MYAFFLGLFSDISSSHLFGMHAFLYVITSLILYRTQKIFLKDKWLSLLIINVLFSLTFYCISYPTLLFFNYTMNWTCSSFASIIRRLIFVNSMYSLVIYVLPHSIWIITSKFLTKLRLQKSYDRG
ncbi:rod shape-determining MreD family protein [Chlamydia ibidis]|uniref:Rod shape-determining MreD family protein n=2 Tax=Chlamydia ibidis TaxID=1405396 RepID=S7J5F0_9CHLA|nr:rod shape-determining MreD family protein [Chlamydia ibidis]